MKVRMWATALAAFSLTLSTIGCSDSSSEAEGYQGRGSQSVEWNEGDDPNILDFGQNFEYRFDELPVQGETTIPPWAGSYWPTYLDSINDRWDKSSPDTLSPAKKYETAFGKTGIEDAVSLEYGVDSMKHRTPCTDDSVCNAATGSMP